MNIFVVTEGGALLDKINRTLAQDHTIYHLEQVSSLAPAIEDKKIAPNLVLYDDYPTLRVEEMVVMAKGLKDLGYRVMILTKYEGTGAKEALRALGVYCLDATVPAESFAQQFHQTLVEKI